MPWEGHAVVSSRVRPHILQPVPASETGIRYAGLRAARRAIYAWHGGDGRIVGTVTQHASPQNIPVRKRVWLIDPRTGILVAETWSDPATGAYEFRDIDRARKWMVLSQDETHAYRAVVADHLDAEPMP